METRRAREVRAERAGTVRRRSALRTLLVANPLVVFLLAGSLIALLVGEVQEPSIIWAIVPARCILSVM